MSAGLLAQYIAIGVIVLISTLVTFRKLAPQLTNRWLAATALHFDQQGHPAWQRALGRYLQPKEATGNCSDGCSTCGACGPKPPAGAHAEARPLEFRPRAK
jgi:hypothetical protein